MKVLAHRGFSGAFPQNTMLAFREAEKTGCSGIELDVQMTKDGQLVIIHDEFIDDVTDGKGLVRDYTYEELSKFNAAAKWNGAFGFQKIPTFEEYCAWVKNTNLVTNVELKNSIYYYMGLEEKVVETIHRFGLEERIFISSFNHMSLLKVRQLDSTLQLGALVENGGIGNPGYYCKTFGIDCYHPGIEGLTREAVENCKKYGIKVNVWTVNQMNDLKNITCWGCDGIITNYPDVCSCWVNYGSDGNEMD